MVYELSQDYFVLDDFTSGFDLFFKLCGHIAWSHVLPSILHFLFTSWLLALEKYFGGICPIVIDEMTYFPVAHKLVI